MRVLLLAAALIVGGCAQSGDTRSITPAEKVQLLYVPVRTAAVLCAAGVKPCQKPEVSSKARLAIPIADAAVDEAVKALNADPSEPNIVKWSRFATEAIGVLAAVLAETDG